MAFNPSEPRASDGKWTHGSNSLVHHVLNELKASGAISGAEHSQARKAALEHESTIEATGKPDHPSELTPANVKKAQAALERVAVKKRLKATELNKKVPSAASQKRKQARALEKAAAHLDKHGAPDKAAKDTPTKSKTQPKGSSDEGKLKKASTKGDLKAYETTLNGKKYRIVQYVEKSPVYGKGSKIAIGFTHTKYWRATTEGGNKIPGGDYFASRSGALEAARKHAAKEAPPKLRMDSEGRTDYQAVAEQLKRGKSVELNVSDHPNIAKAVVSPGDPQTKAETGYPWHGMVVTGKDGKETNFPYEQEHDLQWLARDLRDADKELASGKKPTAKAPTPKPETKPSAPEGKPVTASQLRKLKNQESVSLPNGYGIKRIDTPEGKPRYYIRDDKQKTIGSVSNPRRALLKAGVGPSPGSAPKASGSVKAPEKTLEQVRPALKNRWGGYNAIRDRSLLTKSKQIRRGLDALVASGEAEHRVRNGVDEWRLKGKGGTHTPGSVSSGVDLHSELTSALNKDADIDALDPRARELAPGHTAGHVQEHLFDLAVGLQNGVVKASPVMTDDEIMKRLESAGQLDRKEIADKVPYKIRISVPYGYGTKSDHPFVDDPAITGGSNSSWTYKLPGDASDEDLLAIQRSWAGMVGSSGHVGSAVWLHKAGTWKQEHPNGTYLEFLKSEGGSMQGKPSWYLDAPKQKRKADIQSAVDKASKKKIAAIRKQEGSSNWRIELPTWHDVEMKDQTPASLAADAKAHPRGWVPGFFDDSAVEDGVVYFQDGPNGLVTSSRVNFPADAAIRKAFEKQGAELRANSKNIDPGYKRGLHPGKMYMITEKGEIKSAVDHVSARQSLIDDIASSSYSTDYWKASPYGRLFDRVHHDLLKTDPDKVTKDSLLNTVQRSIAAWKADEKPGAVSAAGGNLEYQREAAEKELRKLLQLDSRFQAKETLPEKRIEYVPHSLTAPDVSAEDRFKRGRAVATSRAQAGYPMSGLGNKISAAKNREEVLSILARAENGDLKRDDGGEFTPSWVGMVRRDFEAQAATDPMARVRGSLPQWLKARTRKSTNMDPAWREAVRTAKDPQEIVAAANKYLVPSSASNVRSAVAKAIVGRDSQDAPTSQRGRITLHGYTPEESAAKLKELGIVGDLEPKVPLNVIMRSERREGRVLPLHPAYVRGEAPLPESKWLVTHGVTDRGGDPVKTLQRILEGGGLHSIAERFRRGINARTASPAGDIRSGIDHVVFGALDSGSTCGSHSPIRFAFKPEAFTRRDLIMAPRDFGGMSTRYEHYKGYLNRLQDRAGEAPTNLYQPPSPAVRQKHLTSKANRPGSSEFNLVGSVPIEDIQAIGVSDQATASKVEKLLVELAAKGITTSQPKVVVGNDAFRSETQPH